MLTRLRQRQNNDQRFRMNNYYIFDSIYMIFIDSAKILI